MKLVQFFVVASLSACAVAGCGKLGSSGSGPAGSATLTSANAPKGGSCNEDKAGVCTEYADNPMGLAEGACTSMFKGTYAKGSCATDKLVGTCQRKDEKQFYYFGNGVAAWTDDAKEDCEKNPLTPGTFTAAAGADQAAKDNAIPASTHITASCQHKDTTCDDITGRLADLEKSFCEDGGNGVYADGKACGADGLVGSCVKHGKVARYYTASLKNQGVKDLQKDCEDQFTKGHWYPGPAAPAAKAASAPTTKAKTVKTTKPKK